MTSVRKPKSTLQCVDTLYMLYHVNTVTTSQSATKIKRKQQVCKSEHYYTHTHTPLTALCPGLHGWAGTRKVLILLKQETVSGSGISWAVCKYSPCFRQTTMPAPHHSVSYRPDALPATQPTVSKHWRHRTLLQYLHNRSLHHACTHKEWESKNVKKWSTFTIKVTCFWDKMYLLVYATNQLYLKKLKTRTTTVKIKYFNLPSVTSSSIVPLTWDKYHCISPSVPDITAQQWCIVLWVMYNST